MRGSALRKTQVVQGGGIVQIGHGNLVLIKQGAVKVKCKLFPPSSLFLITEQERERAVLLIAAAR